MSQAPIMPFFTDAYLADTHHLSTSAHGAYLLLLLHTWRCNGTPPADDNMQLARITKLNGRQWPKVRREIEPFFDTQEGVWRQKRLEKTWQDVQRKIEQQRLRGAKGNASQRAKRLAFNNSNSAVAALSHKPINHKPSLKNKAISDSDNHYEKSATPALDKLREVLSNIHYFVEPMRPLSAAQYTLLAPALCEMEQLLHPANDEQIDQLIDKIWRLFPTRQGDDINRQHDYREWFAYYPAALIADVCDDLVRHHKYSTPPRLSDFAALLDPIITQRRMQHKRLQTLLERHQNH